MSVIDIDIEEYLNGVVPAEIGNADLEAGKAQAIAARTFAYNKQLKQGYITDQSAKDQAFRASRFSNSYANAHRAVAETKGQVLFYDGALIANANYSHANGGRTYSCKEKWGSDRPYLIARNDPWDYAYSKGKKNGHGVGLSQSGAKYAASIGILHQDILQFYYPGTQIMGNYGLTVSKGGSTMELTNIALVEFARKMIGQPYWYGTHVVKCSQSLLERKTKQYPAHYGSSRKNTYNSHISQKLICTDCIGLIKGFMWTNGGQGVFEALGTSTSISQKYESNNFPDKSANNMFTYAKKLNLNWGPINTIPETLGLAVRFDGHVGVYAGNGKVIEAKGFAHGVKETELAKGKWDYWYEIPGLTYINKAPMTQQPSVVSGEPAIVNLASGRLNIRKTASVSAAVVGTVLAGTSIIVTSRGTDWCKVSYNNMIGYVATEYLLFKDNELSLGDRLPLSKSMKGGDVVELQEILMDLGYDLPKYKADGDFGNETLAAVKRFQKDNGLTVDGTIDSQDMAILIKNQGFDDATDDKIEVNEFSTFPTVRKNSKNNYVKQLQKSLNQLGSSLSVDGIYGTKTENAVRAFQKKVNIKVDGICGPNTWLALSKELNK